MRALIITAIAITLAATPAHAKLRFAAYEGPDAVKAGEGGTKLSKNGVDFWTSGSPPRRF